MQSPLAKTVLLFLLCTVSAVPVTRPKVGLDIRARQPQSYSVVAVDGGSSTAGPGPAATRTVTDAVTINQVQTSVMISTIVATPSNAAPTAQLISQTITMATTVVQTPSPSTVTVQPSVSSVPFDDGQWHTTYYFRTTMSPSMNLAAVASSPSSAPNLNANAAALATPTVDLGQWAPWANKGQGTGQSQGS